MEPTSREMLYRVEIFPYGPPMSKHIDMVGQVCGHVTVHEFLGVGEGGTAMWRCQCRCGTPCILSRRELNPKRHRSCGCNRWRGSKPPPTGSVSSSPTYRVWINMKDRCSNPQHDAYPRYGGRGVTVCPEWQQSFELFHGDMGDKPDGMQLERLDNDGPYCKANCKWATRREQCQNRSNNLMITIDGETLCATEWARRVQGSSGHGQGA